MIEKIDPESLIKKREINELIQSILNIKRQEANENINETPEIKLGRRLEQRSYDKLSKEILEHLITRYEIDHNKYPTRETLIDLMINFLGNIQKTPDYYNLKNDKEDKYLNILDNRVGKGVNGEIYSIKPDELITKKVKKDLAFKLTKIGKPYNIDIHISSAILLAYYDFQPKYYNHYFMEIGKYEKKNKERIFINAQKGLNTYQQPITIKNIRWYILFNFTNIKDQVHNLMLRSINEEFIKIDIGTFNSEYKAYNINHNLNHINNNMFIFQKNKKLIINELNKILIINEEFLLDLIIFRTRRGCFNNIDKEDLAIHFNCLSSCYKVIKLNHFDNFQETYKKYVDSSYNKHFQYNLALSWMLYDFSFSKVLTPKEYNHYIKKFNKQAFKFDNFATKIRNEEIPIANLMEHLIDIDSKVSYNKNNKTIDNTNEFVIQKEEEKEEKNQYEIKIEKNKLEDSNYLFEDINNLQINSQKNSNSSIENNEDDKDEILDLKVMDYDINDNNNDNKKKMNHKTLRNNIMNKVDRTQIRINKKKEQKKSCWFCCGKESVSVED